jgi:hypothetical protein
LSIHVQTDRLIYSAPRGARRREEATAKADAGGNDMDIIANVERPAALLVGSEREILANLLDTHRATLLWKCEGLAEARLRTRSVAPSELSLFDLLRHLTGAERYWFQVCLDGRRDLKPLYLITADGEIDDDDPTPLAGVVENFRTTCEESRRILGAHALDEVIPSAVADGPVNARYVGWHMVEEYARHNGHADLLRESIDGTVGQ